MLRDEISKELARDSAQEIEADPNAPMKRDFAQGHGDSPVDAFQIRRFALGCVPHGDAELDDGIRSA